MNDGLFTVKNLKVEKEKVKETEELPKEQVFEEKENLVILTEEQIIEKQKKVWAREIRVKVENIQKHPPLNKQYLIHGIAKDLIPMDLIAELKDKGFKCEYCEADKGILKISWGLPDKTYIFTEL